MKSSFVVLMLVVPLLATSVFACDTIEIAPFKTVSKTGKKAYAWLVRSQDSENWYTSDSIPINNWEFGSWITAEVCGDSVISQKAHRSFIAGIHDIYIDESTPGSAVVQVEINLSRLCVLLSKGDLYEELPISVINDSTIYISTTSETAFNIERYLGTQRVERYRRGIVLISDENDSLFLRKID